VGKPTRTKEEQLKNVNFHLGLISFTVAVKQFTEMAYILLLSYAFYHNQDVDLSLCRLSGHSMQSLERSMEPTSKH
jgi:hypothetical protein